MIRRTVDLPRRAQRHLAAADARRCATCSPTTGRSCSARSRSTPSSCWSRPASTWRCSSSRASPRPSTTAPTRRCDGHEDERRLQVGRRPLVRRTRRACSSARPTTGRRTSSSRRSSCTCMRVFFTGAFRRPRELTWLIGLGDALHRRCSRATSATRWSTTCSRAWGWRSATASRSRSRCSAATSRWRSGAAPFPGDARVRVAACTSPTCSSCPLVIGGADRRAPRARRLAPPHAVPPRAAQTRATALVGVADVPGPGAALARPAVRRRGGALPARRPRADQPDLAVGALRASPGHQRRPARLVPGLADRRAAAGAAASTSPSADYTIVPNPFWGGALFPLVVLLVLALWPWVERRITGDHGLHNLLDRPRDAPGRTAGRPGLPDLGLPRLRRRAPPTGSTSSWA